MHVAKGILTPYLEHSILHNNTGLRPHAFWLTKDFWLRK